MDWIQILTIIATMIASVYVFFLITKERIDCIENFHRIDMKTFREDFQMMDEKWERLFERQLIQDQK
jgi:hypothetical protein